MVIVSGHARWSQVRARPMWLSTSGLRIRCVRTARHGFCDILNISALILRKDLGWKQGRMNQMHDIEARCRFAVDMAADDTGNLPVPFFFPLFGFHSAPVVFSSVPLAYTISPPYTICIHFLRAGRAAAGGGVGLMGRLNVSMAKGEQDRGERVFGSTGTSTASPVTSRKRVHI